MYRVLKPFEFLEPNSIEEAVGLLGKYGAKARLMAGGIDLVHKMRLRQVLPEYVISLQQIPELNYITDDRDTGLRIGALATLSSIASSPVVRKNYAVLHEGISSFASVQVKNAGTALGNLCAGTPATDVGPPLFVLDAELKVVSNGHNKTIPIESLFVEVNKTILEPQEIVTEIFVPKIPEGSGGAFLKIGRTRSDIAKVNVAVMVLLKAGRCERARIALGSVAPTVIRSDNAEAALQGEKLDQTSIAEASELAAKDARPITDFRSTSDYRRHMVRILVRDALVKAVERANGGGEK